MVHVGSLIVMLCIACSLTACSPFTVSGTTGDSPKFLHIADTEFRKAGAFKVDMLRMGYKKSGKFEPLFMPELPTTIPVHLSTEAFTEQSRTAAVDAGLKAGNTVASGGLSSEISKKNDSKGS